MSVFFILYHPKLVSLWFIIISLVFFYLCKVEFSGFLQLNGNVVDSQNNSNYRDCGLLRSQIMAGPWQYIYMYHYEFVTARSSVSDPIELFCPNVSHLR